MFVPASLASVGYVFQFHASLGSWLLVRRRNQFSRHTPISNPYHSSLDFKRVSRTKPKRLAEATSLTPETCFSYHVSRITLHLSVLSAFFSVPFPSWEGSQGGF